MTGIIYLIVGILIRTKTAGMPTADQMNRRVFRSLFCIISVNIGGYCIHTMCTALIRPLIQSPITTWFFLFGTGILLNIGAASNGPILYFTSSEYRQAFQTVFPFVFKRRISAAVNQIAPQQIGPHIRVVSLMRSSTQ
ncbi:hypothetical protein niasHT_029407 [Heterodera trifolii]|uniref:Uncharacterized protein n=1 Tax=Heterodera trifolii TaxID=157864 RepID=A0ABD2KQ90_9BILA